MTPRPARHHGQEKAEQAWTDAHEPCGVQQELTDYSPSAIEAGRKKVKTRMNSCWTLGACTPRAGMGCWDRDALRAAFRNARHKGAIRRRDVIACRQRLPYQHNAVARRSTRYSPWLTSASTCLSNNAQLSILTSPARTPNIFRSALLHHPAIACPPSPPRRRVSTDRSTARRAYTSVHPTRG
jgi:hypothetical protein